MVAFLGKLPELDARQYRELVDKAPAGEKKSRPQADKKQGSKPAPAEGSHSGMPMK